MVSRESAIVNRESKNAMSLRFTIADSRFTIKKEPPTFLPEVATHPY